MRVHLPSWLARWSPVPGPPRRTPIGALRFVVLDTEATGLNPKQDRILSIGAVRVRAQTILVRESWECRVRQHYRPRDASVEVHGLLPATGAEGLEEAEALRQLEAFIGEDVVVGHHIGFDLELIRQGCRRQGLGARSYPHLDTLNLAARLDPPQRPQPPGHYSLDALCGRYGIRPSDRHTAAGDALLTARLLLLLLARLQQRGVRDWGALSARP